MNNEDETLRNLSVEMANMYWADCEDAMIRKSR